VSSPSMDTPDRTAPEAGLREQLETLARRNAELEQANQDLEWSLFVASHDLQECLRTVITYAQFLAKRYGDRLDGEEAMFVNNVIGGAGRMRDLLSDLLAYSAVGANPRRLPETVNLNTVMEIVKENLKASIEETRAIITSTPLPVLKARASDFIPLFQNLVANAIKYRSQRRPEVHVAMHRTDGQLWFAISDNGIGIASEHHEEIFDPFMRLHGRDIPGTGIGLAICRRIVQRYSGRIWVESRLGAGATFRFTLPEAAVLPTDSV